MDLSNLNDSKVGAGHAPPLRPILTFLEMIKFEHSIFALPFAYVGLILGRVGAGHAPPLLPLLFWVTLAMVSCRTMGMALNRLIDWRIDAANPRTQMRALPAGQLKVSFVVLATVISFFIYEGAAYQINDLCFRLSFLPVVLTILYPFTKRFTWLSHGVLGSILAMAPYGAWLASRGGASPAPTFSWIPAFLSLGVFTWVTGFDIIYALQDLDFDRQYGLHSIPVRFDTGKALAIAAGLHAFTLLAWYGAGQLAGLGFIYIIGLAFIGIFFIREHWLIHQKGLAQLNRAFFTMNALISVAIFAAVVLDLLT